MDLSGKWRGTTWGTNNGYLFADLTQAGQDIGGEIRLEDVEEGHTKVKISGKIENGTIMATLSHFESYNDAVPSSGTMTGNISKDGCQISGSWTTNIGTSGQFVIGKYLTKIQRQPQGPMAFISKTVNLRAYKFDRSQLIALLKIAMEDTNVLVPTFSFISEGRTVTKISIEEFLKDAGLYPQLNDLSIAISEPAVGVGYRAVNIDLTKYGINTLVVMGENTVWVEGKISQLVSFLSKHEAKMNYLYRKYGNEINSLIFILMLIVSPSIASIKVRTIFVITIFIILIGLLLIYRKIFPNTIVFMGAVKPSWWKRNESAIIASLTGALATGIIGYIVKWAVG